MKIALLSGADKNAGDFLIVKRAHELIQYQIPEAEIKHFRRNDSLEPFIDEINECDYLVFAGGPGYVEDMYPGRFPLVDNLDRVKPKMFALGMGCYGRNAKLSRIKFNESTKNLLNRLELDGFGLGCRDLLTYRTLQISGVNSVLMTGCPAWYDLDYIEKCDVINPAPVSRIRKIAVSDPASEDNFGVAKKLISQLKCRFPKAEVELVFHRGWNEDEYTHDKAALFQRELKNWCGQNGVFTRSIAYSSEGFSVYDECDFHIGFRVHAHIYSLSHRRPSFLLEEDGRGFGVNESLDQKHFSLHRSYMSHILLVLLRRALKFHGSIRSRWEDRIVAAIIEQAVSEINNDYKDLLGAFKKMQETYKCMSKQLNQLRDR